MKEFLIYAAIYYSGFAVAFAIAYHNIKKFKTNDPAWVAAVFSWILVLVVIVVSIYKLFRKEPEV